MPKKNYFHWVNIVNKYFEISVVFVSISPVVVINDGIFIPNLPDFCALRAPYMISLFVLQKDKQF